MGVAPRRSLVSLKAFDSEVGELVGDDILDKASGEELKINLYSPSQVGQLGFHNATAHLFRLVRSQLVFDIKLC